MGTATIRADDSQPAGSSVPSRDADGFIEHVLESPYQAGKTRYRVLLPDRLVPGRAYPVVYVLPVEPGDERRYGDGLIEVRDRKLHNSLNACFVAPSFSHLPWYADHPTNPAIRQESYLLKSVIPPVETNYPVDKSRDGRLLLGFSKSGWGAWTLLLRNPKVFGRAAAWDAPFLMEWPCQYGSMEIFQTKENFEAHQIGPLLRKQTSELRGDPRLYHAGYGSFRKHHQATHELMESLKMPEVYHDGPQRKHDWHSGWVNGAVEWLMSDGKAVVPEKPSNP